MTISEEIKGRKRRTFSLSMLKKESNERLANTSGILLAHFP